MTIDDPAEADLILVNTCSVRDKAEQRAIGRLNDLSRHSGASLAVCGCMAQRLGEKLFELIPRLSIVAGPDNYFDLPGAVLSVIDGGGRMVLDSTDGEVTYGLGEATVQGSRISRFLSITRGCENFCSYCIVPYLRGPVRSKEPGQIVREIGLLVETGVAEITLLGQNVMAYSSGTFDFSALVEMILGETELKRLRFLTTHPRDLDVRIFHLMNKDGRFCPHIHLPFQAGSDRILKLMKRGYTRDQYIQMISRAREIRPDLAVSTDIIVGFPGETKDDFEDTLDIVKECRFDSAFTFKYSPRSGTEAAKMEDDVSMEEKVDRLETLNTLIQDTRRDILQSRLGSLDEIILDDKVKKGEYLFWKGRTPHFRNVLLRGEDLKQGEVVKVSLNEIRNFTFIGEKV